MFVIHILPPSHHENKFILVVIKVTLLKDALLKRQFQELRTCELSIQNLKTYDHDFNLICKIQNGVVKYETTHIVLWLVELISAS